MIEILEELDDSGPGAVLLMRPNRSLSWRQNLIFVGIIGCLYAMSATVLGLRGYWPVLPWAIIDLGLLFGCLYWLARQGSERQVLRIGAEAIEIQGGKNRQQWQLVWPRERAFALIQRARHGQYEEVHVFLRQGSNRFELGAFLPHPEREELVQLLSRWIPIFDRERR